MGLFARVPTRPWTKVLAATIVIPSVMVLGVAPAASANRHGVASNTMQSATTLAPTTTSIDLTSHSVTFGAENSEVFGISVRPRTSGQASVNTPTRTLCPAQLHRGKGSCSPSATMLPVGTYAVVAAFAGTDTSAPSTSSPRKLIVLPATITTTTTVPPTTTTTTTVPPTTTTTTVPPTTTTTTTVPGSGGGSILGVYGGAADPKAVGNFATTVGTPPKYATDFLDGTSWASITQAGYPYWSWQGKGYSMVWGVNMLPDTYSPNSSPTAPGGSCYGLTQEASGAFNSYFKTVAQNIVNAGFSSSIIRLGWEFNGGWFPWAANGCSSAFAGSFQQIVTSMRSVSGQKFTFMWNPTRGDLGVGNLVNYYPGNSYVDYVGLDVYDVEWAIYPGMPQEFSNMETQSYGLNWLAALSAQNNKPMVFPEWGLGWGSCSTNGGAITAGAQVCGGDDSKFINLSAQWFASHNVAEATFWDFGSSSIDGGANPLTAAALHALFG